MLCQLPCVTQFLNLHVEILHLYIPCCINGQQRLIAHPQTNWKYKWLLLAVAGFIRSVYFSGDLLFELWTLEGRRTRSAVNRSLFGCTQ